MGVQPQLKWWTGTTWRPNYDNINCIEEEPTSGKLSTTITCAVSDTEVHDGDSITITATLKSGGVALGSKTVIFEKQDSGGSWNSISTGSTNGSGVKTYVDTPTETSKYRCRFATDASYVGSTSSTKNVMLLILKSVTEKFNSTWTQCYKDDNSKKTSYGDDLGQNVPPRTSADKLRSLVGFKATDIQAFLADAITIDTVEFFMRLTDTYGFGSTSINLGGHSEATLPTTWVNGNVDEGLQVESTYAPITPADTTMDITTLGAEVTGDNFADATWKGIAIGPAPNNSLSWYLTGAGESVTKRPWIQFTVTKWAE